MAKTKFEQAIQAELNKLKTPHEAEPKATPSSPCSNHAHQDSGDTSPLLSPGDMMFLLGNALREPEGRMTLLPVADRKPLPERTAGRPSQLELIIEYSPETYVELLLHIRRGAYYHVASEAVGIQSDNFANWLKYGKSDIGRGVDSVYNRFRRDIQRAAAQARVGAEIAVATTNPQKWLSHGPGKSLGNHWSDSNGKNQDDLQQRHDPIGELVVDIPQLEDSSGSNSEEITKGQITFQMDATTELAVIEAEESAGIFKYTQEYKDSLKERIKKETKRSSDSPLDLINTVNSIIN